MRINGVQVRAGQARTGIFQISTLDRTADGTAVGDHIADKRRLELRWTIIKDTEIQQILNLLSGKLFHTITYPDPQRGEDTTITVYRGDVWVDVGQRIKGTRYFENFALNLVER